MFDDDILETDGVVDGESFSEDADLDDDEEQLDDSLGGGLFRGFGSFGKLKRTESRHK